MLALVLLLALASRISAYLDCAQIEDPPSQYTCGSAGNLKKPNLWSYLNGEPLKTDFDTCSRLLAEPVGFGLPSSLGYNFAKQQCFLYNSSIAPQRFEPNSNSKTKFYDRQCFNCFNQCPDPAGSELMINGGFEFSQVSAYPLGQYGNTSVVTPGFNSSRAFRCSDVSGCSLGFNTFPICPGTLYQIAFHYRVDPNGPTDNEFISIVGNAGDYLFYLGPLTSTDNGRWQSITSSFQYNLQYPPSMANFFAESDIVGHGLVTIDGVTIKPLPNPIPMASHAVNLLRNGDFETGQLAPWVMKRRMFDRQKPVIVPGGYPVNGPKKSEYAVHIVTRDYYERQAYIAQDVRVVPGTTYLFRLKYKKLDPPPPKHSDPYETVQPAISDSSTTSSWADFRHHSSLGHGWFQFERVYVARESLVTVRVEMLMPNGLIDDVELLETTL